MQKKHVLYAFLILLNGLGCRKKQNSATIIPVPNNQHISVLTQHNNNERSGQNNKETKLTVNNVNTQQFGKLFDLPVDDQVYAQPLVVGNVSVNGENHNVVYIATVNNTVYAFDADNSTLYWKKSFNASGMRPPRNTDMTGACGGGYQDFSGNFGIVGTPVIDSVSQLIYFVARSTDGTHFVQYLHAADIKTGEEASGSPVIITANYTGNGDGSVNNLLSFDPQKQNQRQALSLVNGIVYISFSSHCDWGPYHGWILGYNAHSLQQQMVYNDTPDGANGGIWESGMGLAADAQGNLYAAIGNGSVGLNVDPTNLRNRSMSAIKLTPSGSVMTVSTYFTPYNYQYLNDKDLDFGSIGSLLIPNSNYFFTGSKDGSLYLLDKDNMGGYQPTANLIQQSISLNNPNANEHCQAAYYNGGGKEFVYVWSENDYLRALPFNRTTNTFDLNKELLSTNTITSSEPVPGGQSGAMLSVSSNDTTSGTGILWASFARAGDAEHTVSPGILCAFDASNITKQLWSSEQNPSSDRVGYYAKFSTPTIANGHVYLATFSNTVAVFGIK